MTDEEMKLLNHISTDTIIDDIKCTMSEIEDFESELEVLKKNPVKNKLDIYMREGKVSKRSSFIDKLQGIIEYRIRTED